MGKFESARGRAEAWRARPHPAVRFDDEDGRMAKKLEEHCFAYVMDGVDARAGMHWAGRQEGRQPGTHSEVLCMHGL